MPDRFGFHRPGKTRNTILKKSLLSLLSHSNHSMQYEVKKGFVSLPKGCYIHLEKKASEVILANIRRSFGDRAGLIARIESFTQDQRPSPFLEEFHRLLSPRPAVDLR